MRCVRELRRTWASRALAALMTCLALCSVLPSEARSAEDADPAAEAQTGAEEKLTTEKVTETLPGNWWGVYSGHPEAIIETTIARKGNLLVAEARWRHYMSGEQMRLAMTAEGRKKLKKNEPDDSAWASLCISTVTVDGAKVRLHPTALQFLYPKHKKADKMPVDATFEYERPGILIGRNEDGKRRLYFREGIEDRLPPMELEKGKTHHLACLHSDEWHYRIYIPEKYDHKTPVPVLINSAPGGNARPLSTKMADELGWIMVGLTERRNRKPKLERRNRSSVIFDLRRRFRVDWKRVYASGFSGGARCASLVAMKYPDICGGLICMGAAYAYSKTNYCIPPYNIPVAFIVGEKDKACYKEVTGFYEKEKNLRPCKLIVHPGGHGWGPKEDQEAAIRWLEELHRKKTR